MCGVVRNCLLPPASTDSLPRFDVPWLFYQRHAAPPPPRHPVELVPHEVRLLLIDAPADFPSLAGDDLSTATASDCDHDRSQLVVLAGGDGHDGLVNNCALSPGRR